jgi:Protein of unknown function (DUF3606)
MSQMLDQPATPHRGEIRVTEPGEVSYWTERLGVSEHALRQAVADVGESVDSIAEHLGKSSRAI